LRHYSKKIRRRRKSSKRNFLQNSRRDNKKSHFNFLGEKLTPEAKELLESRIGYRTETACGEGYRDAKAVIDHEIRELGNVEEQSEIAERLGLPRNSSLEEINEQIDRRFGPDAKVLWLTTKEGVKWYLTENAEDNIDSRMSPEEIDAAIDRYKIPDNALLVVDLGSDGQLFLMSNKDFERIEKTR
jgi:hypothetical protein